MKTALVHSEDWARFDYGPQHPLRMERLGLTWRLMQAYGLTRLPGSTVHAPVPATEREIAVFHTPEYLEVLKAANTGAQPPGGGAFGLGPGDNPVFRGLWEAAQLVAAGSLLAADLVAGGEVDRAFHFAGGLHHALPDRASGFCYVNDAVLAILRLRERGLRVAYVDIDAHHGDGVQYAFYRDPSVLQSVAVNASDAWQALRRGNVVKAAKHVLDRRNVTSLKAVWEERKWIGGV